MTASNQINNDLGFIATGPDGTKHDSIGAFNFAKPSHLFEECKIRGFRHVIPISNIVQGF